MHDPEVDWLSDVYLKPLPDTTAPEGDESHRQDDRDGQPDGWKLVEGCG